MKETALVTGASSGIGLEMCRELSSRNINLIIVARSTDKLIELKKELNSKYSSMIHIFTKDLSDAKNAEELYHEIKQEGLKVTMLINNAGFGSYGDFAEKNLEEELRMIQLNISSLVVLTKLFLKDMIARKHGYIMNMASLLSFMPFPYFSVYAATKSFVLYFSEALSAEVQGTGVSVTTLCPGPTDSNFASDEMEQTKAYKRLKLQQPADVAKKGIDKMLRKKGVVILGLQNKLIYLSTKISFRKMALAINKDMATIMK